MVSIKDIWKEVESNLEPRLKDWPEDIHIQKNILSVPSGKSGCIPLIMVSREDNGQAYFFTLRSLVGEYTWEKIKEEGIE